MILDGADTVSPAALLDRIDRGDAPIVLDVRSAGEFAAGHVPGAMHIPFTSVLSGIRRPCARRSPLPSWFTAGTDLARGLRVRGCDGVGTRE